MSMTPGIRRSLYTALVSAAALLARADLAPVVTFAPGAYITNWLLVGTFPNKPREGDTNTVRVGFITDYLQSIGG